MSCSFYTKKKKAWHDTRLDVLGFINTSTLWVILYCLTEKERKEIEEKVQEMKESDRKERV